MPSTPRLSRRPRQPRRPRWYICQNPACDYFEAARPVWPMPIGATLMTWPQVFCHCNPEVELPRVFPDDVLAGELAPHAPKPIQRRRVPPWARPALQES